jgi:hypothetical protein
MIAERGITVTGVRSASEQATRRQAQDFVRRTLAEDAQYRPIHLTAETLVELLVQFREQEKW